MPLPALLLSFFAAGLAPPAIDIVVVGRPWAPFISPMGEPFRARAAGQDTLGDWFHQADRNHDGSLTPDEMLADAERFFARLDADHNGAIEPEELVQYEWEIAPEIQVGTKWKRTRPATIAEQAREPSRGGEQRRGDQADDSRSNDGLEYGLQGAGRYTLLNIPEPVAAADANFDRAVSLPEFKQAAIERFALLDKAHQGRLSLPDLEAQRPPEFQPRHQPKRQKDSPDSRVGNPLPSRD